MPTLEDLRNRLDSALVKFGFQAAGPPGSGPPPGMNAGPPPPQGGPPPGMDPSQGGGGPPGAGGPPPPGVDPEAMMNTLTQLTEGLEQMGSAVAQIHAENQQVQQAMDQMKSSFMELSQKLEMLQNTVNQPEPFPSPDGVGQGGAPSPAAGMQQAGGGQPMM